MVIVITQDWYFISCSPSFDKMASRDGRFCRFFLLSQIIYSLLEVSESSNMISCMYEKTEVNSELTLPATVTHKYTGVMTSQTTCSLACCSKVSTCAGFVYDKRTETCLLAVEVMICSVRNTSSTLFILDILIHLNQACLLVYYHRQINIEEPVILLWSVINTFFLPRAWNGHIYYFLLLTSSEIVSNF